AKSGFSGRAPVRRRLKPRERRWAPAPHVTSVPKMQDPAVHAFAFDGRGGAKPVDDADLPRAWQANERLWIRVHPDHPEARDWLATHAGLAPADGDALMGEVGRSWVAASDHDTIFGVMEPLPGDAGAGPLRLVLAPAWLILATKDELPALTRAETDLRS